MRRRLARVWLGQELAEPAAGRLDLVPGLLEELERRHILLEDVDGAVAAVEAEKAYFVDAESGHRLGAWRPRNVTFWVEYTVDRYGRRIPRHAHGTENLGRRTSSARYIVQAASALFERIADKKLTVRRLNITATHVVPEGTPMPFAPEQMDLFTDYEEEARRRRAEEEELAREKRRQKAVLGIKDKYGKNAILKGMNLEEGATARSRNEQIGGHKA